MRQDQWQNTVVLDGKPFGIWDTISGGDVEATETKYRRGGMQPERSLGGPDTVNNITLGKLLERSDWSFLKRIVASGRVGKARASVSRQPLDIDGNPFGEPLGYSGILLHVTPGDTDSNSEGAQVWQIVVSTDGVVS